MQTCAGCRHWKPPSERTDYLSIWRTEAEWPDGTPKPNDADRLYGQCTLIDLGDSYEPAPDPPPLAVTKDGSDYRADLFTQADFGCVLWETRGDARTPGGSP